jgi:hypothetical protein
LSRAAADDADDDDDEADWREGGGATMAARPSATPRSMASHSPLKERISAIASVSA